MARSRSRSPPASPTASSIEVDLAGPRLGTTATTSAFYEAGVPPTLANNLLHPPRPSNQRSNSWKEILTASPSGASPDSGDKARDRWDNDRASEQTALLGSEGDESEAESTPPRGRATTSRSRSRSAHRKRGLPWYKRPSPIWLLVSISDTDPLASLLISRLSVAILTMVFCAVVFQPGTFMMAISMGLTYAPKLEIYTQLICRSMDPAKSKVSLPPPVSTSAWHLDAPSPDTSMTSNMHELYFVDGADVKDEEKEAKRRDREWANQCHRSSAVQSSVARLALILTLMMGILSSLTTGWWGSYSDRKGRKRVLILAMFGTVAMDSVFLMYLSFSLRSDQTQGPPADDAFHALVTDSTVNYHRYVSYNFLLLGPVLDGLLGGFSTAQATTNAYLSDCTSPGSRARIFSLLAGLMFAGFALGPILSSVLLSYAQTWFNITDPTQIVLIPFYIALSSHLVYLGLLCLALPESLSESRREASQKRYEDDLKVRREFELEADERASERGRVKVWARRVARNVARLFGFLRPLGLLLPKKLGPRDGEDDERPPEEELRTNIEWGQDLKEYWTPEDTWNHIEDGGRGRNKRDWSLTKIALAYAAYMSVIAIISVKLQYANYTFDWSAREDGLFLSYIGVLRVVALLVFLPLFIRLLRRPSPDPTRPRPIDTDEAECKQWDKEKKWLKVVTDSHFDLRLARLSLLLDFLGFLAFALISISAHPTPAPFLVATFVQSLGSGASPTLQSLALAHSTPRDSGRLFASFSVVQSIASQVVGPILFGTTFINTVGKGRWTGTVFWVATALCAISWTCVSSLRLKKIHIDVDRRGTSTEHETSGGNA